MLTSCSWDEFDWNKDYCNIVDTFKKCIKYILLLLIIYLIVYEFPRDLFIEDNDQIARLTKLHLQEIVEFKEELSCLMLESINNIGITSKSKFCFGLSQLDVLFGGGLPFNSITEIYGSAGSGKSQLCLQLVSNVLKSENDAKILYICSQERFPIDRLLSMLGASVEKSLLDRVHIQYFLDSDVEYHYFRYSLLEMMREFEYKLIIFDNIASNARNIGSVIEKSEHINCVISSLKRLFLYYEVCVIINNQITDVPGEFESLKTSALGLALENNVNLKIYVEKTKIPNERRITVQKSLYSAISKGSFVISSNCLKGLTSDETRIENTELHPEHDI